MKNGQVKKKKKRNSLMSEKGNKKKGNKRSSSMQNRKMVKVKSRDKTKINPQTLKEEFIQSLENQQDSNHSTFPFFLFKNLKNYYHNL